MEEGMRIDARLQLLVQECCIFGKIQPRSDEHQVCFAVCLLQQVKHYNALFPSAEVEQRLRVPIRTHLVDERYAVRFQSIQTTAVSFNRQADLFVTVLSRTAPGDCACVFSGTRLPIVRIRAVEHDVEHKLAFIEYLPEE